MAPLLRPADAVTPHPAPARRAPRTARTGWDAVHLTASVVVAAAVVLLGLRLGLTAPAHPPAVEVQPSAVIAGAP